MKSYSLLLQLFFNTCCTEKKSQVVFNIPLLMRKNIDFVCSFLRPPIPVLVPFIEPASSNNTAIYKRNSNKLLIDFNINSRELSQLMIVDCDGGFKKLSDLLKIVSLDSISNE